MNNADFWASVHTIIAEGFTSEGLLKLDSYAEQFISGRLVYQRFSPQEQHGCATGGATNVIASLLAGAEAGTDSENQGTLSDYQRECQLGAQQEAVIEQWAKAVGLWTECVEETLPKSHTVAGTGTQSRGQVLGHDGCYDSGTCPYDYVGL